MQMDMTGYTKLFRSIVASTIWREPHTVRIVWITMLAMANKNGIVEASLPGLADLARVSIQECEEALNALSSPDKYSRTPDYEGRRIMVSDGGWKILNHEKYRNKMGADERREYLRQKQQESREKRKLDSARSDSSTLSTQSEADAQAAVDDTIADLQPESGEEGAKKKPRKGSGKATQEEIEEFAEEIDLPKSDGYYMVLKWEATKWPKNWQMTLRQWKAGGFLPSQKQQQNGQRPNQFSQTPTQKAPPPKTWNSRHSTPTPNA